MFMVAELIDVIFYLTNNDVKTFGKNCHSLSIPGREGLSTITY
jgi:hypothetical protein